MQLYVANQIVINPSTGNPIYSQGQTIDQDEYNLCPPEVKIHFSIKETVPFLFDGKLFKIPVSADNLPASTLYSDEGTLKIVLPS